MKILKPGVAPSDRIYTGTCAICHAEVEFARHEGTDGGQRDPGIYVKCPTPKCDGMICGTERRAASKSSHVHYPGY